jgi:hypothetical protein
VSDESITLSGCERTVAKRERESDDSMHASCRVSVLPLIYYKSLSLKTLMPAALPGSSVLDDSDS